MTYVKCSLVISLTSVTPFVRFKDGSPTNIRNLIKKGELGLPISSTIHLKYWLRSL